MRVFHDTWLLFVPHMKATLRNPIWLMVDLFMPICYMLLFTPLLANLPTVSGGQTAGALATFTPGLLIMMSLYSVTFVGYNLLFDLRQGVIERLRVTPVSRLALLLGRVLHNVTILLLQSVLLLLVAWLLGLHANLLGILATFILLVLVGLLMASLSYALALAMKNENTMGPALQVLTTPLLLLSGIILPLNLAPPQIHAIADVNPLAYAVYAARDLFIGDFADVKVLQGFVFLAIMALLVLCWAASNFRRAIA
ncbi:MAG: ABC transporter permease [Ktedonobacteraceae bacterium]|nr:ABC transporter permease [Ktedonobacteraceae bacterium]